MDSLASLRAGKSRLPLCGMVFCVWSVWFLWLRLVRPEREVRGRLNPRGSSQETPFSVPVPQKARVYTSRFFQRRAPRDFSEASGTRSRDARR